MLIDASIEQSAIFANEGDAQQHQLSLCEASQLIFMFNANSSLALRMRDGQDQYIVAWALSSWTLDNEGDQVAWQYVVLRWSYLQRARVNHCFHTFGCCFIAYDSALHHGLKSMRQTRECSHPCFQYMYHHEMHLSYNLLSTVGPNLLNPK